MSNLDYIANHLTAADRREQAGTPMRRHLSYEYYTYDGQKLGVGVGVSVNISEHGMLIETDKPLEPLMPMLVEIVGQLYIFMATARVVHVQQTGEKQFHIGVSFQEIIQGGWALLARAPAVKTPTHLRTDE